MSDQETRKTIKQTRLDRLLYFTIDKNWSELNDNKSVICLFLLQDFKQKEMVLHYVFEDLNKNLHILWSIKTDLN